jgi:SagB-type dehydrogenase family enzyme
MNQTSYQGAEQPGEAIRRFLAGGARPPLPGATIDWRAMPPPFKTYRNASRIRLPFPITVVDPSRCHDGLALIGNLLGGLLGFTRAEWIPDAELEHPAKLAATRAGFYAEVVAKRATPSGGGLYPSELYLATAARPDLAAGLYHYAPGQHVLERLALGDLRTPLLDTLAVPPPRAPDLVLLVTSVFWRTAFKYAEFAHRLQGLDAGVLAGQALALADAAGMVAKLHLDFADGSIDRLLALDSEREGCYLLITLSAATDQLAPVPSEPPRATASALGTALAGPPRAVFPLSAAAHRASLNQQPLRPGPGFSPPDLGKVSGGLPGRVAMPSAQGPGAPRPIPLALDLADRRSAMQGFRREPIPMDQLATVIMAAVRGYDSDVPGTADRVSHTCLYLAANRVAGLDSGIYRLDVAAGHLDLVHPGDAFAALAPAVSFATQALFEAAAVVIPVGDFERGFPVFGDRWYRIQNTECGLIAQRLSLGALGFGFGSHIRCDYDVARLGKALRLEPDTQSPLAMVFIGLAFEPGALQLPLTSCGPGA